MAFTQSKTHFRPSALCRLTHPDNLAHVLRRHVLLGRLDETKLALVGIALAVQLLPLARLCGAGWREVPECGVGAQREIERTALSEEHENIHARCLAGVGGAV
eukprot:303076-Chlamydomonas_euryale.AAC.5